MVRVPLTEGYYQARSFISNAQRCLNLYPEAGASDSPSPMTNYPTPGLTLLNGSAGTAPVRCLYTASNNQGYAIIGNTVYKVSQSWGLTSVGTLPTSYGSCFMQDNGSTIVIIDRTTLGYQLPLASSGTVSQISDPTGSFVGSVNVSYLDSFFIFSQPNTNVMYCSLSNSLTFDPLYLAAKSGAPDWIAGIAVCQRLMWIIGQKTTEIWYDAGAADFPFGQVQGSFFQHGCVAPSSIAVSDTHVWWLGQDAQGQGVVYNGSGGQITRISTHAIEQAIQNYIVISDAIGMTYQQNGHNFYILTFPSADKTFCWDDATQLWHERCWLDANATEHRHRANCIANMYGVVVVGDWQNGYLYQLDPNNYTDNGAPIKRERGFPHLPTSWDPKTGLAHLEGKRIRYDQFIADMECGEMPTTNVPVGAPATVLLQLYNIAFTSPPTSGTYNLPLAFMGTVSPSGNAVQIAFGTSATVPPTTGWVSATVTGGTWSGTITPKSAGSLYAWAQETLHTGVVASTPVSIAAAYNAVVFIRNVSGAYSLPANLNGSAPWKLEALGAGGTAGTLPGNAGAGAYSAISSQSSSLVLSSGQSVFVQVGAAGAANDTWLNASANSAPTLISQGLLAKAGVFATNAGAGGNAAQCVGVTCYSGGNGGNTGDFANPGAGGAAGPNGSGQNGGNSGTTGAFLPGGTGGGGGGGANGGMATAGASSQNGVAGGYYQGANGGNGNAGTGAGAGSTGPGGFAGGNGTSGGGGGGGWAETAGGAGGQQTIWTQTSDGATAGPGGGGGGGGSAYHNNSQISSNGAGGGYGGGGQPGAPGIIVLSYNTSP